MYLIDTNVISESRKGENSNPGVRRFMDTLRRSGAAAFLSVVTIGEIRKGIALLKLRGDKEQAARLDSWLKRILDVFEDRILDFSLDEAQVWGQLLAQNAQNPVDKQVAATALRYDLTVVTRNTRDFDAIVRTLNPFD